MTVAAERARADRLLALPAGELDARFRAAPAGPIPRGAGEGTLIVLPGTRVAAPLSAAVRRLAWQGKVFRAGTGDMLNRVGPTGIRAVRARVHEGASWLDGRPCVVLDYAGSSLVAGWLRDELRELEPGLHLGIAWGHGRLLGGRKLVLRFALAFA